MDAQSLDQALLLGAVVLLVAIGAVRLSLRAGLPSLLVYLLLGVLLGQAGLTVTPETAQTFGLAALALILAEGGLTTRWNDIRPSMPGAVAVSTVGVGVSVAVVAVAARLVYDVSWETAVVLGAIVSSTDAAAVFSQLRRLRLSRRLVGLLEAESGLNDAPVVILVTLLVAGHAEPPWRIGLDIIGELAVGAVVGLAVGWIAARAISRSALPSAGLYPLGTLAFALLAYALSGVLHGSGFLAVYVAGLVLGNADLPHRRATVGFAEGVAWLAQIGLFVMLGVLVEPHRLLAALAPALAIGAVLLLLARPLSVLVSLAPFRLPWREQAFLSWCGLRGAVPIVLATIPLTAGTPGSLRLFDTVVVLVVVFTLVQAPLLAPLARWLHVEQPGATRDLAVEAAPLERMHADLLQLTVRPGSLIAGLEVWELRLPLGSMVTLLVRDGESTVPVRETRLRAGDELLVVATHAVRTQAEDRLRAVSDRGRLASWRDDDDGQVGDPMSTRRRAGLRRAPFRRG